MKIMRYGLRKVDSFLLSILAFVIPKKKNLVLFGSTLGKIFSDSSSILFLYLLKHHADEFQLIWMTNSKTVVREVQARGGTACLKNSFKGIWYSIRANVIVVTHEIMDVISFFPLKHRPKEIKFLHGVPGMRKAFTINNASKKVIRDLEHHVRCMTLHLTTSEWAAEKIQEDFGLPADCMKITGLPRNDVLFPSSMPYAMTDPESPRQRFKLSNFVILYAPAWRRGDPAKFFPFGKKEKDRILGYLRKNNVTVILRPHIVDCRKQQSVEFYQMLSDYSDILRFVGASDFPDVQYLLPFTDCLITDYSSIHYDYLLLDRPMIFLPYDYDTYVREVGGLNCDYDEFAAGPKPSNAEEFLESLGRVLKGQDSYAENRKRVRDVVHQYQDGFSSERVYKVLAGFCK